MSDGYGRLFDAHNVEGVRICRKLIQGPYDSGKTPICKKTQEKPGELRELF